MIRRASIAPAAIAAAVAVISSAVADPPPVGTLATFLGEGNEVLVCDTLDEIERIFRADDRRAMFLDYFRSLNAKGFRACEFLNTSGYVLSVIPLGAFASEGTLMFAWGLELGTTDPGYSFWVLHVERLLTV
jgi:hypothetical protein